MVEASGDVFEAKFMLPWSFSEEGAAEKHMPQLQHNMWVTNARMAALSIITGGGKWVEIGIPADALYQHLLLTAERKFWRCVESGELPRLFIASANEAAGWAHRALRLKNTLTGVDAGLVENAFRAKMAALTATGADEAQVPASAAAALTGAGPR